MPTASQGYPSTLALYANEVLTVTADSLSNGTATPIGRPGTEPGTPVVVAASATVEIGPFSSTKHYRIDVLKGSLTYSTGPALDIIDSVGTADGTTANALFVALAGNVRSTQFFSGGTLPKNLRWQQGTNGTSESGVNAGSDWFLNAYSDAGVLLSTPISVTRSTGAVALVGALSAGSYNSTNIFTASNINQISAGGGLFRWVANTLTVRDQTNNTSGILGYGWWYQYLINSTSSSGSKQAVEIDLNITSIPSQQQVAGLTFCNTRAATANSVNLTGTALAPLGNLFVLNPQLTNGINGSFVLGMTNTEFDFANGCSDAPQYMTGISIVLTAAHTFAAVIENNGILFGRQTLASPGLWALIQDGTDSGVPALDPTVGAIFQTRPHLGHTDSGVINMGFDLSKYLSITSYILLGPQSNGYIDGAFNIKAPSLKLTALANAANDGAAASAGVAVTQLYRNGSVLMVRVT